MAGFRTRTKAEYGRRGEIDTPHGQIQTPALLPVVNLMGGSTTKSGGIWRYVRRHVFQSESTQAMLCQAMSFLDFNLSPKNLDDWRTQPLRDHFYESDGEPGFDQPLFVDSGGFKLMNSTTFGKPPEDGGDANDWGIYTNPESILDLQLDYGADIIATLDYPIPPNLNKAEATERMERSIDSAVECLRLLDEHNLEDPPSVYVAIHGHKYEDLHWYVSKFLDRAEEIDQSFEGFAIGSLVPLSNSPELLVDLVQGAKDAIPEEQFDDIALHVFGISGRFCPLLSLLGVDTFDSANYLRSARNKDFIHPITWERVGVEDIDDWDSWPCDCCVCRDIQFDDMRYALVDSDVSYKPIEGTNGPRFKSEYYAEIANHNFELYARQMEQIRDAIESNRILEEVADFAEENPRVQKGLKRAQLHDRALGDRLDDAGFQNLVAGPAEKTFQSKLSGYLDGVDGEARRKRTISLKYGPSDFDILQRSDYQPPTGTPVLLILPCSQEKPYSSSRTQQVVLTTLQPYRDRIHTVSVSGLYGPVPEEYEEIEPVLGYEYVLTTADEDQVELVANRLAKYLDEHGDQFDHILAYTTSKAYRRAVEIAFNRYGRGEMYPIDPRALQLTEHFRNANLDQLLSRVGEIL